MTTLKNLIHEAHRRSLWQVLGIYLAVSWVALQIVDVLVSNFGLPDWVPPGALVLLVIGLPIVMATAFVQEGMGGGGAAAGQNPAPASGPGAAENPRGTSSTSSGAAAPAGPTAGLDVSPGVDPVGAPNLAAGTGSLDRPSTRPSRFARLFTWRNAIAGGVLAFAGLGVLVASYWFMWATGVGPVGSLVAQGVLEVGESLRIFRQLLQGLAGVHAAGVRTRSARDTDVPVTAEVAREVALREGVKAVIEGQVQPAGASYLLTATGRAAEDARSLAAFRVTADDPDDVVDAIDELSQRIRERAGESLRTIRAGEALESATTSSLEALRKLTEAERLTYQGDDPGAIALLEEAVDLDPTCAMAYRKLAVLLNNNRMDFSRMVEAASLAFEHRDRLTDRERYLTEAFYHQVVTGDWDAQQQAYRAVLRSHPNDVAALNNLSLLYIANDRPAAEELLERAVDVGTADVAFMNLTRARLFQNEVEGALDAADRFAERLPGNPRVNLTRSWGLAFQGNIEASRRMTEQVRDDPANSRRDRVEGHRWLAWLSLNEGKVSDARDHLMEAVRDAEDLGPGQELQRVIELARVDVDLSLDRRRALAVLGDALDRGLLEATPALDRPYFELARFLAAAGEVDRAERILERWSEDAPPEVTPDLIEAQQTIVRSRLAAQAGDYDRALRLAEEGYRGTHCSYCGTTTMARIKAAAAGDAAGAIAAWEERAAVVDMSMGGQIRELPLVYEQLCLLHADGGDPARAVSYCGLFVEMWKDADPVLQPRVEAARRSMEAAERVTG